MNIYKDSIADFLGLKEIEFEFDVQEAKENSTLDYSGKDILKNTVTCVDRYGNILLVEKNVYQNQKSDEYVIHSSKEGFKRLGKPEEERKLPPPMKHFDFSKKKNSLKGDARTENQKIAAKNHSERMKGTVINKKGEKLSEEHKLALRVPRPGAGKHNNHAKGEKHFAKIIVECPYCRKIGGGGSMRRWHFDNCKKKD